MESRGGITSLNLVATLPFAAAQDPQLCQCDSLHDHTVKWTREIVHFGIKLILKI